MRAVVFPGQGAQYVGMGKHLNDSYPKAKKLFQQADDALGWALSDIMFKGTAEDLVQTKVTQPAIFLESIVKYLVSNMENSDIAGLAGHSLGEFTALVAAGCLHFEEALLLVHERALAMQAACEQAEGTMAAVLGLDDHIIEEVCETIEGVVPANYNTKGQLVISGTKSGVDQASEALKEKGAKRVVPLAVGGAFHSPLMAPAEDRLSKAIENASFADAKIPVYQNVTAAPATQANEIKKNLLIQLTAPVKWTYTIQKMIADGINDFIEVGGKGSILGGMIRKIDREVSHQNLELK